MGTGRKKSKAPFSLKVPLTIWSPVMYPVRNCTEATSWVMGFAVLALTTYECCSSHTPFATGGWVGSAMPTNRLMTTDSSSEPSFTPSIWKMRLLPFPAAIAVPTVSSSGCPEADDDTSPLSAPKRLRPNELSRPPSPSSNAPIAIPLGLHVPADDPSGATTVVTPSMS